MEENKLPTTYFINPKSFVTFKELCQIVKMDRKTILKMIKNGDFPKNIVRISSTGKHFHDRKRWVYQDIIDYISSISEEKQYIAKNSDLFRCLNYIEKTKRRYGTSMEKKSL